VFAEGSEVKLLARIGGYPAGTVAVVVDVPDSGTCKIELAAGKRFLVRTSALSLMQGRRFGHPWPRTT
jgi:hypothetical protein